MPHDPALLRSLAERCEAGEADGLCDDVWRALGWSVDERRRWLSPDQRILDRSPRPDLCRSIDAQAVLGVLVVGVGATPFKPGWAATAEVADGDERTAFAPTEPLARLAATLHALAAKAEAERG